MKKILSLPITLVVVTIIFLSCSYWIIKNVDVRDLIGNAKIVDTLTSEGLNGTEISKSNYITKNPTYEIMNNDVVTAISDGSYKVLVDGENIEGMESITDIKVSPDGNKLCFLIKTIIPTWLYMYDISADDLKKVDNAKNCYWSPDSRYIAYNNHTTDVSPIDLLVYDTGSKVNKNLSENIISTNKFIQCSDISWIDSENVSGMCVQLDMYDVSTEAEKVRYIFNVKTGDIIEP